jgi:uncharacterized membrane protein YraQ (UPF0718 family)
MKTFFKILLGVVILGAIGYTMYFLYQKSQVKPVIYETDSPMVMDIIKKHLQQVQLSHVKKLKLNLSCLE